MLLLCLLCDFKGTLLEEAFIRMAFTRVAFIRNSRFQVRRVLQSGSILDHLRNSLSFSEDCFSR